MPRPIEEVKRAARPLADRILEFLGSAGAGQAYRADEIFVEVEHVSEEMRDLLSAMWALWIFEGKDPAPEFRAALRQLADQGTVQTRRVDGADYYWAEGAR